MQAQADLVLPVNVTAARRSSPSSGSDSTLPRPVTVPSTPAGSPASCSARARCSATIGVSVAGLRTTALPANSAGPSFRAGVSSGSFHGVIASTTPTGSARTVTSTPGRPSARICPSGSRASDA